MADPKNLCSAKGSAPPWRTEALLAAGFLAGSLTTRLRNPRLALLLAAGALAWRALSPGPRARTAPEPILALPGPSEPEIDLAPVCEAIEPFAPALQLETVPFMPEPLSMTFPPAPEVAASHFSASGPIEDALHAEHTEATGCDAWILGLEPLPVVEDLPEEPTTLLAGPGPATPAVQEHRPVIAEGAPLPDMIEITIEPSAEGLSMIQSFSQTLPLVVNEGPVETTVPAPEPVIAQVVPVSVPETDHELTLLTELLEATTLSQPAPPLPVTEPEVQPAPVAMTPFVISPPEPAAVSQWELPAADEAPLTLRPMPRTIKWGSSPEAAFKPRQNPPQLTPETAVAEEKAAENTATAVLNTSRHIVPRAPASAANAGDHQKSWLTWWK